VHGAELAVDDDLGFLDVRIEDPVFLRRPKSPSNTVLVADVASELLGFSAVLTLSQGNFLPYLESWTNDLEW
jgi:hypothetical protein